jgi:hypothetical protein
MSTLSVSRSFMALKRPNHVYADHSRAKLRRLRSGTDQGEVLHGLEPDLELEQTETLYRSGLPERESLFPWERPDVEPQPYHSI